MGKKIKIVVNEHEFNLIIRALNDLRNEQIKKGETTEPINELLLKLLD